MTAPALTDLVARFPLVPRPRPICLPLPQRIRALSDLAQTAADTSDPVTASAVYNQAALLASDVGLRDLASEMCRQHAAAYLHAAPLPADTAIRALEPVINLARLQLRARQGDSALDHLLRLFNAVSTGTTGQFDGVAVPANLVGTPTTRQEVRAWLWRVLLADGSRALTAASRWDAALAHVHEHRGVGTRMLDGRQIAVIAALTNGDSSAAAELIAATEPGEPWEAVVTTCLRALFYRSTAGLDQPHALADALLAVPGRPGTIAFEVRLGLTIIDVICPSPAAESVVRELHRRITRAADGAAAKEALAHALFTTLSTQDEARRCRDLVEACGIDSGTLPAPLHRELQYAIRISDRLIRDPSRPAA